MKKLIWRIQALYWFWRLAGFISWEATGELWDGSFPGDSAKWSVEQELEEWSR